VTILIFIIIRFQKLGIRSKITVLEKKKLKQFARKRESGFFELLSINLRPMLWILFCGYEFSVNLSYTDYIIIICYKKNRTSAVCSLEKRFFEMTVYGT